MLGKSSISEIDYNQAVNLMNSTIIEKNHNILDLTVDDIEESALICEYPEIELNPMRSQIFYLMPEFLIDTNEEKLLKVKKEIEFYIKEYEKLCNKMNDFGDKTNKYLNDLLYPSDNLKKEIEKIIKQFEETIKNLCIPLILEIEGLNTIDISKLNPNRKYEFN